jgi:hypothetical protein
MNWELLKATTYVANMQMKMKMILMMRKNIPSKKQKQPALLKAKRLYLTILAAILPAWRKQVRWTLLLDVKRK